VQEAQQVVGVLPGNVEANGDGRAGMALCQQLKAPAELGVAGRGLSKGQLGSGRLAGAAQEGGVVAVTRSVDADAEAGGGTSCPVSSGF